MSGECLLRSGGPMRDEIYSVTDHYDDGLVTELQTELKGFIMLSAITHLFYNFK